jgi:hypothetical protein
MEPETIRTVLLVVPLAALVVLLSITQASSGPPNPTDSDADFNTAGGTDALQAVTTGQENTAFGYFAQHRRRHGRRRPPNSSASP